MRGITAWAVTTGEAGMRTQARGLAAAVADAVVERDFAAGLPWRWLPRGLTPGPLGHLAGDAGAWPDLLVTCGRRSVPVSLAMRSASPATLRVHIQDPRTPASAFDLVVALAHDDIADAPNVLKTVTAMHDVTPASLAAAAAAWRARLAPLPRPLTGVAVGGPTRRSRFTQSDAARLAAALADIRARGGGLAITPSRRTPLAVRSRLGETFAGDRGVFLWDLAGENPYRAILALADALVVTGDSVSMVSEAIATGVPVQVFDLGEGRHEVFLETLVARGLASRLGGGPPPERLRPYDATVEAAAAVRRLLQTRTGVSG